MAGRNFLAFLQQFLGNTPGTNPAEQAALENEAFGRLVSSGFTMSSAGTFGNTGVTDGQILIGKTADRSLNFATITAGSNVTVTNGAGAITIAATTNAGTVTHTGGALTANQLVIGNGGADITVLGSLGSTTTVYHGNAAGAGSFSAVVENDLSISDVTTANVSTSAHGFAPKAPNDATKFLDGTGAYSTPAGGYDYVQLQSFG